MVSAKRGEVYSMSAVAPEDVLHIDENEFVEKNMGLVHSICKRIYSDKIKDLTGLEYDDLYQIGMLELIKAKRSFKPEYGCQFSTYAVPKISGRLLYHIQISDKVKIPRQIKELRNKLKKEGLLSEDAATAASKLGASIEKVRRAQSLKDGVLSLNMQTTDDDEDAVLEDLLADSATYTEKAEDKMILQQFLSTLSDRELSIWQEYRKDKTQREISKLVGMEPSQMCRIIKKIFQKAEEFGKKLNEDS
jgi:RNA polymerase sporulation-specific sigma factor